MKSGVLLPTSIEWRLIKVTNSLRKVATPTALSATAAPDRVLRASAGSADATAEKDPATRPSNPLDTWFGGGVEDCALLSAEAVSAPNRTAASGDPIHTLSAVSGSLLTVTTLL